MRGTKTVYFVFDEIQRIEGWEDYVLHLLDMPSHRVLITGSTSHLLSGNFATQLRGKCLNHTLHENLSSAGLELSSEAGYRYLRYLKECFAVYAVPIHTQSEKIRTRNPVKIYACDWALASAVSFAGSVDVTRMFENMVFLHLLRQGRTIHYLTTRQGHEVDFVSVTPHAKIELFQACYELNSTSRDRELRAIVGAAAHLGAAAATIVTWAQEEAVMLDGVRVEVTPAWRWMWDGQPTASM